MTGCAALAHSTHTNLLEPMPKWSKAVKLATLETAGSSTRSSGWAPGGPASPWASRQMRPEEAQEPSWGGAQTAL